MDGTRSFKDLQNDIFRKNSKNAPVPFAIQMATVFPISFPHFPPGISALLLPSTDRFLLMSPVKNRDKIRHLTNSEKSSFSSFMEPEA